MAVIYQKKYHKPVPAGATPIIYRGEKCVRCVDRQRKTKTAPLTEDGTRIVLKRPLWYIDFSDADGQRKTVPGYTDRAMTEQKAAQLEREHDRIR